MKLFIVETRAPFDHGHGPGEWGFIGESDTLAGAESLAAQHRAKGWCHARVVIHDVEAVERLRQAATR